jgi:ArsR family transcriptional regulator, virulence genes transcriptional regulator
MIPTRAPKLEGASPVLAALERHAAEAERLLRTLANRHRLMILCALADGELSVGALNARVALSQSALSQHLALLRQDGLVSTRRVAQTIYYANVEGTALTIIHVLHDKYCPSPTSMPRQRINLRKIP